MKWITRRDEHFDMLHARIGATVMKLWRAKVCIKLGFWGEKSTGSKLQIQICTPIEVRRRSTVAAGVGLGAAGEDEGTEEYAGQRGRRGAVARDGAGAAGRRAALEGEAGVVP